MFNAFGKVTPVRQVSDVLQSFTQELSDIEAREKENAEALKVEVEALQTKLNAATLEASRASNAITNIKQLFGGVKHG